MPSITGAHHVALTVTDADRGAEWYSGLLGMAVVLAGDDATVKSRVLADPALGWVLGVRQYHCREGDGFDEFRSGLDHFAFSVESRAALEEWERELAARR
jgi:glyoxylase I family protein